MAPQNPHISIPFPSTMATSNPSKLRCCVQHYDWGLYSQDSAVSRLFSRNSGDQEIRFDCPYAEFWIGTHDSGPSFILSGEAVSLKDLISDCPEVVGQKVVEMWGHDLPFLFKVLSVAKALSIQAHPDKELAKLLHKTKPDLYNDANHKPEMAIALTEFRALCGFITMEELRDVLFTYREIMELVDPQDAIQIVDAKKLNGYLDVKAVLKSTFTKLMTTDKEVVAELVSKLKIRLNAESKIRKLTEKEQLVLLLEKQFHDDVGVIAALFLNYVKLRPGEALYIGPNEPHAYLSGECIECMATSDNVVRAGLTPKYRDVQTLCSMLTYKQGFPKILQGIPLNSYLWRYKTPSDEFEVDRCLLPSQKSIMFPAIPGPSIFLVMGGEGRMRMGLTAEESVAEGDVYFVPAGCEINFNTDADQLELYRAGVNSRLFD